MRWTRLLLASVLLALWAGVWLFTSRENVSEKANLAELAQMLDNQDPGWAREDLFYGISNAERSASILKVDGDVGANPNPDRVRVLVLGDSYTFGQGLINLDARWSQILSRSLAEEFGPGAFEVVTLSRMGASMATYAGWMQDIENGRLDDFADETGPNVSVLETPFDIVLIGFVDNDYVANSSDTFIDPSEFVDTPSTDWQQIITGELPNPNEHHFVRALDTLIQLSKPGKLVVLPLTRYDIESDHLYQRFDLVRDSGVHIGLNTSQRQLTEQFDVEELMVNPVDSHPSPVFQRAIAEDASRVIRELLPRTPVSSPDSLAPRPLVSNYLPNTLLVEGTGTSWSVSYDPEAPLEPCFELRVSIDRIALCEPPRFEVQGRTLPPQYLLCARLSSPHTVVMLDPTLPEGTRIDVELTSDEELFVYSIGYDEFYSETIRQLPRSKTFSFRTDSFHRGLLVAAASTGCPLDEPVSMPAFELELTRRN